MPKKISKKPEDGRFKMQGGNLKGKAVWSTTRSLTERHYRSRDDAGQTHEELPNEDENAHRWYR